MASIVIVTKQCYLICESINYIIVNEAGDDEDREDKDFSAIFSRRKNSRRGRKTRKSNRKPTKRELDFLESKQYSIIIDFVPLNGMAASNKPMGNTNSHSVSVRVTGRSNCLELFSHMVEQIREQIPDHVFLDRMVEKFLAEAGNPNV